MAADISEASERNDDFFPKPMSCKLILVRHGETIDNQRQIMQGQTQGRLTLHGIEQARQLGRQLRDEPIHTFISSDLARAVETANIILGEKDEETRKNTSVIQTPLLRERDWGSFTGRHIPDLQEEEWPQDIETLESLKKRAARFLEEVKSRHDGQTVLAVGHGIINKAVQSVYFGRPMNQIERMLNCEMRVLRL